MDLQLEPVSVFIELILLSALVFLDIISFIVFQISLELPALDGESNCGGRYWLLVF